MSKIILEAQGLCKSFKEEGMQTVDVLKNVSLTSTMHTESSSDIATAQSLSAL